MRTRSYCRLFFFLSFLVSTSASAADYYWKSGAWYGSFPSPTPSEVCDKMAANRGKPIDSFAKVSDVVWTCTVGGQQANISRYGDACPAGTDFDAATGACKPPENPCTAKNGTFTAFSKAGTWPDPYMKVVNNWNAPEQSGCFDGCLASTTDQKCTARYMKDDNTTGPYVCRGKAWFTGQQCGTEPALGVTDNPDYPEPAIHKENKPCVYVTLADGTKTCDSKDSEQHDGQNCGSVNGVPLCVDKPPTKDETDIHTEVGTVPNADGSSTTSKTDTATTTVCTGIGQCTTTKTTVTTTTKSDGTGATTSVTSTCTGARCPDENGNPDGNGDGLGDCVKDCSDGKGESVGAQDWYEPVEDTYASVLEAFAGRVSKAPAIAGVTNFLSFSPSGSCPKWSVTVWVFHVVLDQWCTGSIPWGLVAAVIMGTGAFLAFRIAFL